MAQHLRSQLPPPLRLGLLAPCTHGCCSEEPPPAHQHLEGHDYAAYLSPGMSKDPTLGQPRAQGHGRWWEWEPGRLWRGRLVGRRCCVGVLGF